MDEVKQHLKEQEFYFLYISFGNPDFVKLLLVSNVENTVASPNKSIHSSVPRMRYESVTAAALSFL